MGTREEEGLGATVPSLAYILAQLEEAEAREAPAAAASGPQGGSTVQASGEPPVGELLGRLAEEEAPLLQLRNEPEEQPRPRNHRWPVRGPTEWVTGSAMHPSSSTAGAGAARGEPLVDAKVVAEDIREESGSFLVTDFESRLAARPGRPQPLPDPSAVPVARDWKPAYKAGSFTGLFAKEERRRDVLIRPGAGGKLHPSAARSWPQVLQQRALAHRERQPPAQPAAASSSASSRSVPEVQELAAGGEPEDLTVAPPGSEQRNLRSANCDAAIGDVAESAAPAAEAAEQDGLREGATVYIHGLTGFQADLNDSLGTLEVWMPDIQQWFVRLEGGHIESMGAEHLFLVSDDTSS
mmetsp:Transcript_52728/g.163268  ORF Transcript_52728/g.163268 Transcript_52728/m.163268 type:complete len:353 (+) Transcript_52728:131-1189(+)